VQKILGEQWEFSLGLHSLSKPRRRGGERVVQDSGGEKGPFCGGFERVGRLHGGDGLRPGSPSRQRLLHGRPQIHEVINYYKQNFGLDGSRFAQFASRHGYVGSHPPETGRSCKRRHGFA